MKFRKPKYDLLDVVWVVKSKWDKIEVGTCKICEGNTTFEFKGTTLKCLYCTEGKVYEQGMYSSTFKGEVKSCTRSLKDNGILSMSYFVKYAGHYGESSVFSTEEECKKSIEEIKK